MEQEIKEIYGKLEITDNNSNWLAVRTKPRHEKKVARRCMELKIPYYLPLKDSVRQYKYRVKTYKKPFFPGYIFCKASPQEKRDLYQIGSIFTFLLPNSQEILIHELKQIYNFHNLGAKLVEHKYLKRGKKVKIVLGPFSDFEGIVSKRKGQYKVVLNISLIKQAVAVEVDIGDIILLEK